MKSSKPWLYGAVRAFDAAGHVLRPPTPRPMPERPRRILVSNIGHLGDALLTLGVPRALRRVFPGSEVDVLVSPSGARLFDGHADTSCVHVHDARLLRRSLQSALSPKRSGSESTRALIAELRARDFDIAIELRSYVPNSIPLLDRIGARYLCGFGSAGFAFLLDRVIPHVDGEHELTRFGRVIDSLCDRPGKTLQPPSPDLRHLGTSSAPDAPPRLARIVLHPGTRRRRKRWPSASWRQLATTLCSTGPSVVVTGTQDERTWLEKTFDGIPVDIRAGLLDVPGLVRLFGGTRTFVGVDSFPAHLAAAAGVPDIVVLWHAYADPAEWAPSGRGRVRVLPPAASAGAVIDAIGAVS